MHNKNLFEDYKDSEIISAFAWWEKNRINFNLIVGFTGLAMLIISQTLSNEDIFWIICYGIGANICYSMGFVIEIAVKYYSKGTRELSKDRALLYILGIFISVVTTVASGIIRMFLLHIT